jgi:hypothetical protein
MKTYEVRWTEVSRHSVRLPANELAALLGVGVEELEAMADDDIDTGVLADELANLDDDGFEWLTREEIEVTA